MSRLPVPAVVLFVADVARLSDFYQRVAGMTVMHADAGHAVLELAGFQLIVHSLSGEQAPQPDEAGRVPVREDSYVKFCLPVSSIAAARAVADSLGGQVGPVEREWEARGFRACDGHDPEGNVFQVRQYAIS